MRSLEDRLRPQAAGDESLRDGAGMGLLLALAAILLLPDWPNLEGRFDGAVVGPMCSALLLPAMGLLLALRCGAIDLSVWAAAALGGLLAAGLINRGLPAGAAFAAGVAAGAAWGALNGLLVAGARLPSLVVTAVLAAAAVKAMQALAPGPAVAVPQSALEDFTPLVASRAILVVAMYAAAMLAMLQGGRRAGRGKGLSRRAELFAALCASGALSAAGGVLWLLEYAQTPVPARPIGDLRLAAAAVLAGGTFFAGPGRSPLAGLCLPPAMLLATRWRQQVWICWYAGHWLQTPLLIVMVAACQLAVLGAIKAPLARRRLSCLAAAGSVAGLLALAASWIPHTPLVRQVLQLTGLALWLAGSLAAIIARRTAKKLFHNP